MQFQTEFLCKKEINEQFHKKTVILLIKNSGQENQHAVWRHKMGFITDGNKECIAAALNTFSNKLKKTVKLFEIVHKVD